MDDNETISLLNYLIIYAFSKNKLVFGKPRKGQLNKNQFKNEA